MSIIYKLKSGIMSKSDLIKDLFKVAVSSVQPEKLIQQSLKVTGSHLTVKGETFHIKNPAKIVGFGKAVPGMAAAMEKTLGPLLERGIVSVPLGTLKDFNFKSGKIEFLEGAENNLPDEAAMKAALRIKDFVQNLQEDDTVIVLISGGGSALLPLPKHKITLSEKLDLVKKLGNKGANIAEMNCVRKELSELKGGGLASFCYPAKVISLILSDVLGDPLDIIASGPTCLNTDGPEKALNVLKKFDLYDDLPISIQETLQDNLKHISDYKLSKKDHFKNVHNFIIGNNTIATEEIQKTTKEIGLQSFVLSTNVNGEVGKLSDIYLKLTESLVSFINGNKTNDELVSELSSSNSTLVPIQGEWARDVKKLDPKRDICVILAGEPTVLVTADGKGGRNQHLALSFSLKLSKLKDLGCVKEIWCLSCGTDGIDGPTDAAGAIGFSRLKEECSKDNLETEEFLKNNDSYEFYRRFCDGKYMVKIGHTGTNVMDIHLILLVIE